MKLIHINAAEKSITMVDYAGLADMQKLVGGYIGTAPVTLSPGDVLFVDDDGLMKPQEHFFYFPSYDQPLAGNGIIVGREYEDGSPAGYSTHDPKTPIDWLRKNVRWINRCQVDSWAKANASDAAVTITSFDPSGKVHTEVVARTGAVFGAMPRKESSDV
jgi:hypothetical protein